MPNLPFMETAFEVNITNNARKKKTTEIDDATLNTIIGVLMQSHATLTMKHDVAVAVASTVVAPAVVIETNAFRAIMTRSSAHIFLVCVWPAMSGSGSHTHTQLLLLVSTSFKLCQSALQFQCDTGALPTITFNSL